MNKKRDLDDVGYGFQLGRRALGSEIVRKSQKAYQCEPVLTNTDSWPVEYCSPGTGIAVLTGYSDNCSGVIDHGDLYLVLPLTGDLAHEMGATSGTIYRSCVQCALHFEVIR
jgi:hypothetical protein